MALQAQKPEAQKAELLLRVRAHQKRGARQRFEWNTYCDTHSEGIRNPAKKSVAFLLSFFDAAASEDGISVDEEALKEEVQRIHAPKQRPCMWDATSVDPADLEAARARGSVASDARALLALFPEPWRTLYQAPLRIAYDADRYDLVTPVREMLECPAGVPLSRLHEVERPAEFEPCPPLRQGMLLAGIPLAPEKKVHKSRNDNKKDWVNSPAYRRLVETYTQLVVEQVLPALGLAAGAGEELEAVVQATPVLRVVMPSSHFATKPHRDYDYGHPVEELNYWVPLTPVGDSNSLYAETFPDAGDFQAFQGGVGDMFRWWGNMCNHYAKPNATGSTRVSLDFRLVPRRFWDAAGKAGALDRQAGGDYTRWHAGHLRPGSYYSVLRGVPAPAAMEVEAGAEIDYDL